VVQGIRAAVPPHSTMQIFIKALMGRTITLDVEASETVEDLMAKIQDKEGNPASQLRLVFRGKQLQHGYTLQDYEFEKECFVDVLLSLGRQP
jgi:ubiquitin